MCRSQALTLYLQQSGRHMKNRNISIRLYYTIIGKSRDGLVKIKDVNKQRCYTLPADQLVRFPEIMQAFTIEDRALLFSLVDANKDTEK